MKKSKSIQNLDSTQDKQYNATLMLVKLVATLTADVRELKSELKKQNDLIEHFVCRQQTGGINCTV